MHSTPISIDKFTSFIADSPTAWHASRAISKELLEHGFKHLSEAESWDLKLGDAYFVERGGTVLAFRLPKKDPTGALVVASHTDSPALKLKPHPLYSEENCQMLRAEIYGGPLLPTWFDRDLAIAGRVFVKKKGKVRVELVHWTDLGITIPSLAIHLQDVKEREAGGIKIDKQKHLNALFSLSDKPIDWDAFLKKRLGCDAIISSDLYLVPTEAPAQLGAHGEFFAGYRIDNLASVYPALHALTHAKPSEEHLQISLFWNHEEIGSQSDEGALSPLLDHALQRIALALDLSPDTHLRWRSRSLCLSVDVSHAYNPNYSDKYDSGHRNLLGKGVVLKTHAGLRYATNAFSASLFESAGMQQHASHNELSGGSTVGPLMTRLGIPTVDIGIAQLAMHSTREIMAIADLQALAHLLIKLELHEEMLPSF